MKILEVIQTLSSGGAERLVVDLCNEMVRTEDVYLLILKDAYQFYLPQLSPKVKVLQAHLSVGKNLNQFFATYKIIKHLHPDIVHFHSQARYTVLLANILLHKHVKFFMTIHSDVEDGYRKGMSGLQVRLSGFFGTRFITISPTNFQQFRKVYPHLKQIMIYNGRALPVSFSKEKVRDEINKLKKDDDTIVFIHVARCSEVKNQSLLVNAFNDVVRQGYDVILLIIGANFDSSIGQQLKKISCPEIHFLGVKDNVYDYFAQADCFLLSSLVEGMPMSIIEALLSGVPVISTPVSGAIDVVEDKVNGLICADFTVEQYSKLIIKGIEMMNSLKANAKAQSVNSPWNITKCAKQYLAYFNSK